MPGNEKELSQAWLNQNNNLTHINSYLCTYIHSTLANNPLMLLFIYLFIMIVLYA